MTYRLPWPPSTNKLWRYTPAGVKLSPAARQYAVLVSNALPLGVVEKLSSRLVLWVTLHAPDERGYDVDNRLKSLLDACTKTCLWADDALIDEIHIARGAPDENRAGYVDMWIEQLDTYPKIR